MFALIKAINTRSTGWIVTACFASVPFLLFVVLIGAGVVTSMKRGINRSMESAAASRNDPSPLLTADMTSISGNYLPYQVSLPQASDWLKNGNRHPFDYLFSYQDAYVGIIAENIGVGTSERACDLSQKNLASKATTFTATTPTVIQIDAHSWLTYDAVATVSGINIKYRFYIYADADHTIQIITWTGPKLFDYYAPVFDRVAHSFKLPK